MSLKVWLPLNGNLNNYGTSNTAFSSGTATVDSGGKIGSCYSFNGSSDYLKYDCYIDEFSSNTRYTIAAWIYCTKAGAFIGTTDWHWALYLADASSVAFVCWDSGGGHSNKLIGGLYSGASLTNSWHHLAMTWDGSKISLYVDGVKSESELTLDTSGTTKVASYPINIGGDIYVWGQSYFGGKINDVRIYDYCLSYTEIKELSKALVAHYPLNDANIEPTTNIDPLRGSTLDFGHIESYERTNYMGRDCWHVIVSVTGATGWAGSYSSLIGFSAGYVGTRSCWVNFPPGQDRSGWHGCPFAFENCDVSVRKNYDFDKMGTWQYCYSTATATSTSSNFLFYWFAIGSGSARVEFYIADIQFENKDHPTPYTSNSRDNLVVHDCSGYNRNGTTTTSTYPLIVDDSPRYLKSYHFDAYTKNLSLNTSFLPSFTTGSIEWWAKVVTGAGSGVLPFTGQTTSHWVAASEHWTGAFYDSNCGSATKKYYVDGIDTSSPPGVDGKWHHYVVTGYNLSGWNTLWLNNYGGSSAWNSPDIYYSNIKFYNTILSADDVAHLYKNFGSVDKNRSLLCSEIKENSENIFKSEYIQKYATTTSSGSYGQRGTRNSVPCMLIGPSRFWYGSDDTSNGILKDYFTPNTQYIFDMWMDGDEVVYEGINRGCGFMVWYTDNSVDYTFVITGNQSSPMGFQHKTLITPAGKSVKGIEFYYWTGNTVYYKVGSFIAPVSQASLGTNGVFSTSQIVEVNGIASINKGGSSYVNSIIEI